MSGKDTPMGEAGGTLLGQSTGTGAAPEFTPYLLHAMWYVLNGVHAMGVACHFMHTASHHMV